MKKTENFLTEPVTIPMWTVLLFDFVAAITIALNIVILISR